MINIPKRRFTYQYFCNICVKLTLKNKNCETDVVLNDHKYNCI